MERERNFLAVARDMLVDQGYAGLSMDRLAEATEFSKGTIYQHFSSKEDLIAALLIESMERRLSFFARAREFSGNTREKMIAIGEADSLFANLHPHYFRSELVIRWADLDARASTSRRETLLTQDTTIVRWVREIVETAIHQGDLKLSNAQSAGSVVFSFFSLTIGTHCAILNFPHLMPEMQVSDPFENLRINIQVMLDGLGWLPLKNGEPPHVW